MLPRSSDLIVRLDTSLPQTLPVRTGTAIFFHGACFHRLQRVRELEIRVGGIGHAPDAWRVPRLDLLEAFRDPNYYRSGFWATVPIAPRERAGQLKVELAALLASGEEAVAELGRVQIIDRVDGSDASSGATIAVCMATRDPDPSLFRKQIESLRSQLDTDWVCVISDDCSSSERYEQLVRAVAEDPRFTVSRSERRLGPYRSFERALSLLPATAPLVALCDQDDRWHEDKLGVLRASLGDASLVYSDQRIIDPAGRVISKSMWRRRRNNYTNLASLLIANTVTGSSMLMRREVVELALPFPDAPGWQLHDHWLALVALATDKIAFVDRPLYDYVQHTTAVIGQITAQGPASRRRPPRRHGSGRDARAAFFYGYLSREVPAQALLARCAAQLSSRKRRALQLFISSSRSPLAFAWLALRPLRSIFGHNETLGMETELARGVAWRALIPLRAGRRTLPSGTSFDASCPPATAETLQETRLARWRASL